MNEEKGYEPVGVPGECSDSLHSVALPNDDLVLAVPVGGDDLIFTFAEHQIAHLAASVFLAQVFPLKCIPEPDCAVSGTPTTGK